jgi:hypothetical protein
MSDLLLGDQGRRRTPATGGFDGVSVTIFDRVFDGDDVLVVVMTNPID